jgi:outer membrane protein assembly factor BamD (BamD/ComL family)
LFNGSYFRHAWLAAGANLCLGWTGVWAEEPTDFKAEARQRYEQGQDLRKQGRLSEAISAYEDAIKLGMDAFPRVHLQRASSNLDLKKYDTAVRQYTRFIEKFGLEESCRY